MFNVSPEFLKWKDITLKVLATAPSLTEADEGSKEQVL